MSEIARKVPSGGIGIGVPLGIGGGGDAEAGDAVAGAEADAAGPGNDAENLDAGVPVTDAAVEVDRNATVASSGVTSSDPESSESLFGDAAYGGDSAPEPLDSSQGSPSFSTDEFSQPDANVPEFEEPIAAEEQLFEDDGTEFSTYEGGAEPEIPTSDDEGTGLLGQLWNILKDFTDED